MPYKTVGPQFSAIAVCQCPIFAHRCNRLGFNMGNDIATFLAYFGVMTIGNVVTNLISIGANNSLTGTLMASGLPTNVDSGLDTHGNFEGAMFRRCCY